ncbi:hypothetical protein BAL199_07628 [alpha proteobacterium BAL199]|nr:hypothetical protein BAL199_07628 [alpha proteobacterium BAL199]
MFQRLWEAISARLFGEQRDESEAIRETAGSNAPVVWLLGKTGAGKTSIVAALTGDDAAEIGNGFQPCTRTARVFDLPPEAPLLRFLDTRGLAENGYDPAEDIAWCGSQAHLLLVVARVDDPDQNLVIETARAARRSRRDWPVVVAQTHLHTLYSPGGRHPTSYPYTGGPEDLANSAVPQRLREALKHQRDLFGTLPGPAPIFLPLDLTHTTDGFAPPNFGIEALIGTLQKAAPEAIKPILQTRMNAAGDPIRASCEGVILGYASTTAGAGSTPVPLVGIGGLIGGNALMLRALANRYDVAWTAADFAAFVAALGSAALLWFGVRYAGTGSLGIRSGPSRSASSALLFQRPARESRSWPSLGARKSTASSRGCLPVRTRSICRTSRTRP